MRRTQDGKSAETVGYVTCDGGNTDYPGMLLAGGYYAVNTYTGAFVRTLDEAYRPERALHILGGWLDEASRAFANEHPEVPLVFESRWLDGSEAVRNDMLSASSNVDIYVINVRSGLRTLMEKGYLADLSGSETLLQNVQAMYPQFADALMYDGKLYGFPMSLTVNAWSYNAAALEAAAARRRAARDVQGPHRAAGRVRRRLPRRRSGLCHHEPVERRGRAVLPDAQPLHRRA